MLNQIEEACLRAYNDGAAACLECATACLQEADPKPMARCIGHPPGDGPSSFLNA